MPPLWAEKALCAGDLAVYAKIIIVITRCSEQGRTAERQLASLASQQMAYGVIGNTAVSGTAILGSSPGRPAVKML